MRWCLQIFRGLWKKYDDKRVISLKAAIKEAYHLVTVGVEICALQFVSLKATTIAVGKGKKRALLLQMIIESTFC